MKKVLFGVMALVIMIGGFIAGLMFAEASVYEEPTELEIVDWYCKHEYGRVANTVVTEVREDQHGVEWYEYKIFDEGGNEVCNGSVNKEHCDKLYIRYHENG